MRPNPSDSAVSLAGLSERYQRGRTPHTALVWWARRPHVAMRAVVERAIAGRREATVLDPFAGGATIPIEARRAGAIVTAVDNNELAVFINRLAMELAPAMAPEDVRTLVFDEGIRVLEAVARITAPVFPLRGHTIGGRHPTTYLWTYRLRCLCGHAFLLSKRRWLSRRRSIAFDSDGRIALDADAVAAPCWDQNRACCPKCDRRHAVDVRRAEDVLVGVVYGARGLGKVYVAPVDAALSTAIENRRLALLGALGLTTPAGIVPRWSGIVNPALYGLVTHGDVLNPRQQVVALALIGALRERFDALRSQRDDQTARFVVGVLSGLIDQIVDWSSRLSMWIPQNEQIGRAFSGPGVAMLFDYAEIDPALRGPANLMDKLTRIADGAAAMLVGGSAGTAMHGAAQRLPLQTDHFDAVVTDPPYYDNIAYTALADFFYAWKQPLLSVLEPDLFGAAQTRQEGELVASRHRHGDDAHTIYTNDLAAAFQEIARVLKPGGTFALVYSHAAVAGWTAFVDALARTNFVVREVLPLSIERRQRPRAMNARSIDTCVTFFLRHGDNKRGIGRSAFERNVRRALKQGDAGADWPDADAALAAFAHGLAVLIDHGSVDGVDTAGAIVLIEAIVRERFPDFMLLRRRTM